MEGNKRKQSSNLDQIKETFRRSLVSQAKWNDKDEFLDVVYWMRQVVGVICGVVWGLLGLKGMVGIGLFVAINFIAVYLYATSYQKVDEEEYGGMGEITKEGFMTSFSTFLVLWIVVYSTLNAS